MLEDAFQKTTRRLLLYQPLTTHGISNMVQEVRFATHNYTPLKAVVREFLFVAHTTAAADKLFSKEYTRYKTLSYKESLLTNLVGWLYSQEDLDGSGISSSEVPILLLFFLVC